MIVLNGPEQKWVVERCEVAIHLTLDGELLFDRSCVKYLGHNAETKYRLFSSMLKQIGFIANATSKSIVKNAVGRQKD